MYLHAIVYISPLLIQIHPQLYRIPSHPIYSFFMSWPLLVCISPLCKFRFSHIWIGFPVIHLFVLRAANFCLFRFLLQFSDSSSVGCEIVRCPLNKRLDRLIEAEGWEDILGQFYV
jgi:hypothetical protein